MMLNPSIYLSGQSSTRSFGRPSRRVKTAVAAILAVMAMTACGQKGPLYLPQTNTNLQAPVVAP